MEYMKKDRRAEIIERLKNVEHRKSIAEDLNLSINSIGNVGRKNDIATRTNVRRTFNNFIAEGIDIEKAIERTAVICNVHAKGIKDNILNENDHKEIIQELRKLKSYEFLEIKFRKSKQTIKDIGIEYGIMTKPRALKEIDKKIKSGKKAQEAILEVAKEGRIDLEALVKEYIISQNERKRYNDDRNER